MAKMLPRITLRLLATILVGLHCITLSTPITVSTRQAANLISTVTPRAATWAKRNPSPPSRYYRSCRPHYISIPFSYSSLLSFSLVLSAQASEEQSEPNETNSRDTSGEATVTRKRRIRRKLRSETTNTEQDSDELDKLGDQLLSRETVVVPVLTPRPDAPVGLSVTDVRELVQPTKRTPSQFRESDRSVASSVSTISSASSTPSDRDQQRRSKLDPLDDSLEQLLADAREMQALERREKGSDSEASSTAKGVLTSLRNAISTLVTVDFFIVCGFLVWFLTGVFASYVLRNDAMQIAFNGIFQPLVQPALGILMIAALADAAFKKSDDDTVE